MDNGKPLSAKMVQFCALVASGESQTDSYIKAYNTKKMTRRMASTEGSKLMKIPKVSDRVAKLKSDSHVSRQAAVTHDRDWITEKVIDIIGDSEARNSDRLRALEILSKIRGLFDDTTQVVIEHRSSDELKADLKEKLSRYLGDVN